MNLLLLFKKKQKRLSKRPVQGFSLAEVLVAAFLFTLIFGAFMMVYLAGSNSWAVNSTQIQVQQSLRNAIAWMESDLIQAGVSTITNVLADGSWYTSITFKVPSGVSAGVITWSSDTIQYILGGASGHELHRISGGVTKVITPNIQSLQIRRLAATPNIVEVSLQAQKNSPRGTVLTLTKSFKVNLRN